MRSPTWGHFQKFRPASQRSAVLPRTNMVRRTCRSEKCQQETHALQQLAALLGAVRNIKRDQHTLLSAWSADRKAGHPAVANSFAICAKPGWSACRKRSIIALFSDMA